MSVPNHRPAEPTPATTGEVDDHAAPRLLANPRRRRLNHVRTAEDLRALATEIR